ncbi:uncharacterized protein [Misgurnus anguillicaudatus]|uniref:uncharacterized protein n=1 Tax=Misgurnus anguillicaudatus TaxID=75329 RepID=UPI002436018C|nr:uncharacterized protein LOC129415451 [Misgurnus anguillicaudatus]
MEAAGGQPISALEEFLQRSLARMDHQDQTIEDMRKAVQAMVAKVSELSQRSPNITPPTAPPMPPAPSSPPGAPDILARGDQSGVHALAALGQGCPLGDGGMGKPRQLLFLVRLAFRRNEEGFRSLRRREGGRPAPHGSPAGGAVGLGLCHRVPYPGGGVQVERGSAVGPFPAWVGGSDPSRDHHGGITEVAQRSGGLGDPG